MPVTTPMTYPGLYHEADDASNAKQKTYLRLVKCEYASLFIASVFALDIFDSNWYYVLYAIIFVAPFCFLMARTFLKPEQGWYQSRALAESIKTSTWKYVMMAAPYEGAEDIHVPHANFRNHLLEILKVNQHIGRHFGATSSEMEQVTKEMDLIRSLPPIEKLALYVRERIDSQRTWYAKKASWNRKQSRYFIILISLIYGLSAVLVLSRIAQPSWRLAHAEPLVVVAAALIGWMQIKKFNELGTSYNLTAMEIGIMKSRASEIDSGTDVAGFVDEAETAFSREHTQWVARTNR